MQPPSGWFAVTPCTPQQRGEPLADFDTLEPVGEGEILYRRIPVSTGWYQADKQPPLEPEAFRPTRSDMPVGHGACHAIEMTRQPETALSNGWLVQWLKRLHRLTGRVTNEIHFVVLQTFDGTNGLIRQRLKPG